MNKLLTFFKYHSTLLVIWLPMLLPHIFGLWPYTDWSTVRFREVTTDKITLASLVEGTDTVLSNLLPALLFLGLVMIIWGIGAYLYQRFWLEETKCYYTVYFKYGLIFFVLTTLFSYGISRLDLMLSDIVVDDFSTLK